MSISQNYPTISPSLDLSFALTKKLDPRITFARASTATYYDGKTVAKAEENLFSYSQEFDNGYWLKFNSTITTNSTTAPDNTTTAESLNAIAGTSVVPRFGSNNSFVSGNSYVVSFYAKANTHGTVQVYNGNQTNVFANFDVSTGTVGTLGAGATTSAITSVGNGWYRCSMTYTQLATGTQAINVYLTGSSSATYAQSWNPVGTESIFIWGAQLEQRSTVTAYTPTTTQPITNYIPVLLTAPANVARFDHDPVSNESLGLLIEEQRTNQALYSEQFDNVYWTKLNSTLTPDIYVAPDGTLSGDLVASTSSSAGVLFSASTLTGITTKTLSYYISSSGTNKFPCVFAHRYNAFSAAAIFDLENGVVGKTSTIGASGVTFLSSSITNVGNGWYRCSITYSQTSETINYFGVGLALSSTDGNFDNKLSNPIATLGDTTGQTLPIWGAQLEAGAFPTSYIKTVASQVTRAADSASMTGANFSSWYRADEGTVYVETTAFNSARRGLFNLNSTTTTERIALEATTSNALNYYVLANGAYTVDVTAQVYSLAGTKAIATYAVNNFAFLASGATPTTDLVGTVPSSIGRVFIGSLATNSIVLNGTIKKLAYYPARLTNEQLVALTS